MRKFLILALGLVFLSLVCCAGPFTQGRVLIDESFRAPDFHLKGLRIGFITPSSAQELEDHWILLGLLAKTLQEKRKEREVLLPSQSLSLINQAGMSEEYSEAIKDFQMCGILNKKILTKLGDVLGVQYVVHLSLNSFNQYPSTRLNILGLRAVDSHTATLRLFVRIFQTDQGRIVWEGSAEGILVREEFRARPITFNELGKLACERLIEKLS